MLVYSILLTTIWLAFVYSCSFEDQEKDNYASVWDLCNSPSSHDGSLDLEACECSILHRENIKQHDSSIPQAVKLDT
jgi:hypothetical protein